MKTLRIGPMAAVALAMFAPSVPAEPLASWDVVINGATRFRVLAGFNNAAVLDKETELVWERSPDSGTRTWFVAHRFCVGRSVGNGSRLGWRLPTVQEIVTLIDQTRDIPFLPAGHPFTNVESDFYWSSTTFGENPDLAWGAGFENNLTQPGPRFTNKDSLRHTWCVRSGHGGTDVQ